MVLDAGYAEMIKRVFPPFQIVGFTPNFTGYDFDDIDWYRTYEALAQDPDDAVLRVSDFR